MYECRGCMKSINPSLIVVIRWNRNATCSSGTLRHHRSSIISALSILVDILVNLQTSRKLGMVSIGFFATSMNEGMVVSFEEFSTWEHQTGREYVKQDIEATGRPNLRPQHRNDYLPERWRKQVLKWIPFEKDDIRTMYPLISCWRTLHADRYSEGKVLYSTNVMREATEKYNQRLLRHLQWWCNTCSHDIFRIT